MNTGPAIPDRYDSALALLRELRRIDMVAGVRNSRIAFDVAMMFFETSARQQGASLTVDRISVGTGHTGPTVRLVLKRLLAAQVIASGERLGKTQFYVMTTVGFRGFEAYIEAIEAIHPD